MPKTVRQFVLLFLIIPVLSPMTLLAQDIQTDAWGSLTGQLIYDGTPPAAEPLDITRDEDYCGPFKLKDESLTVDPDTRGIRYVAVWLDSREDVPIHPDLRQLPDELPELDNKDCRFEPRMLGVRTGQELRIANSDPIAHNAAAYVRRNQPFSIVIAQNAPLVRTFDRAESFPVRVECSIHSWMRAYVLICDHPYFAVTDTSGKFQIRNIPAGEWTFHFWHERPGHVKSLTLDGAPQQLERGRLKISIPAGETVELGQVLLETTQFDEDD